MDLVDRTVEICGQAIGAASDRLGGVAVKVNPDGRLLSMPDGSRTLRIKVRIVYSRHPGEAQERLAIVRCLVSPEGRVEVLPLEDLP